MNLIKFRTIEHEKRALKEGRKEGSGRSQEAHQKDASSLRRSSSKLTSSLTASERRQVHQGKASSLVHSSSVCIRKLIKKKQVSKEQRMCEISSTMAPPPLNVDKNRRTTRKKIAKVKDIYDVSDVLDLDKLSTASEALAEAWQKYANSHQDVLVLLAEDKHCEDEAGTTSIQVVGKS